MQSCFIEVNYLSCCISDNNFLKKTLKIYRMINVIICATDVDSTRRSSLFVIYRYKGELHMIYSCTWPLHFLSVTLLQLLSQVFKHLFEI